MKKSKAKPYLYILPAMVLALVFVYAPFFGSVLSSFFNVRFDGSFSSYAGLDNYRRALSSDIFWQSLGNTFRFMVIFVPLNIIVIMPWSSSGCSWTSVWTIFCFLRP